MFKEYRYDEDRKAVRKSCVKSIRSFRSRTKRVETRTKSSASVKVTLKRNSFA